MRFGLPRPPHPLKLPFCNVFADFHFVLQDVLTCTRSEYFLPVDVAPKSNFNIVVRTFICFYVYKCMFV